MGRIGHLAKDTIIYGTSSIVGRLLNWLLVPLYTQYMAPADYGIVTELYAYVAFLVILYTYGMETAYFRYATKEGLDKEEVYNQVQTSIVLSTVILSAILILFATPVINFLEYPGKEKYIIWFALILAIDSIVAIPFARLRLYGRARRFAMAKLINISINVGLNLFFIIFCLKISEGKFLPKLQPVIGSFFSKNNLADYVFLSNLVANSALLFLLGDLLINYRFRFSIKTLKPMYSYAFPLLIMGLAGVTNEMLSRAMLKKLLPEGFYPGITNQAALGIFGAAYKLSVFMSLAIQAFRYAAEPFFFTRSQDIDSKDLFGKVMHWFIVFGCLILLIISLNLDIIGILFLRSSSYRDGLIVVPILLLANLFLGIYYNLSAWFKLTDKTYWGTIISFSGAAITIVLNIILIPIAGYWGSSFVTLICYLFMSMTSYLIGQKYYPINYTFFKDAGYIIISTLIIYVGNSMISGPHLLVKMVQLSGIILFVILVVATDKKNISQLIKQVGIKWK
jgi:O-antigen/teichoic acid export membrane protein